MKLGKTLSLELSSNRVYFETFSRGSVAASLSLKAERLGPAPYDAPYDVHVPTTTTQYVNE